MLKNNERLDDLQIDNKFVIQNKDEYCFTSDAVQLANFVKAKPNDKIVDLCGGSGVVGILIQTKTGCEDITEVEIQEYMADMCRRSVEYNGQQNYIKVVNAPLQGIHKTLGLGQYSVVVVNPPYKDNGVRSEKESIRIAKHEVMVNLEEIIAEASKLLKFGGRLYIVNREERLTDICVFCRKYNIEPKILKILPSSKGDSIILVEAKKGGKSGLRIRMG